MTRIVMACCSIFTIVSSLLFGRFYIQNNDYNYNLMIKSLEANKAEVYLLSKYISELAQFSPRHNEHDDYAGIMRKGGQNIYTKYPDLIDRNSLENVIYHHIQEVYAAKLSWLHFLDLIYVKLYASNTIISSRPMAFLEDGNYDISYLFSQAYCEQFWVCSKYVKNNDLDDGLIISEPHVDKDSNELTITIIAPIYINKVIVGDVHLDILLNGFAFLADYNVEHDTKDDVLQVNFYDSIKSELLSYKKSFYLDNRAVVNLYLSMLPVVAFFIGASLLSLLVVYLFKFKDMSDLIQQKAQLALLTDPLTGCYNRNIITHGLLINAFNQSVNNTVFVIDGNKIKHINDNFGHDIGDIAIVNIANILREVFRKGDFVVRYGGDEFLIIAIGLEMNDVDNIITRIHTELRASPVVDDIYVSVSIGVAECTSIADLDRAFKLADRALYQHKASRVDESIE